MRLISLLLLLGLAPLATAQTLPADPPPPDPYTAQVTVPDPSGAARDRGLREALGQVVARVGGETAPARAASLIERAPQLVQRYGYETLPGQPPQLVASFDGAAVEKQLRALGIPVWGVSAAAVEDLRLDLSNVRSAADYARALKLLRSLPGVRQVGVIAAVQDRLQLRLRAEGGAARLSGALYANGQLQPETPVAGVELAYRLPDARR